MKLNKKSEKAETRQRDNKSEATESTVVWPTRWSRAHGAAGTSAPDVWVML